MSKLASFLRSFYEKPSYRCLILGVGGVGKTTLLYRMVLGTVISAIPTIGFNCEEIRIGRDSIYFWDIGGCDKIRPLIRHYMHPGHSILFLVDTPLCASDPEHLKYTLEELVYQSREASSEEHGVLFIGVALVKQDLLDSPDKTGTDGGVSYVMKQVKESMEGIFPGGFGSRYDIYTNEGKGGISVITGNGIEDGWLVKELLDGMKHASKGKAGSERNPKEESVDSTESKSKVPMTPPPPPQGTPKQRLNESQLRTLIEKQNDEDPYIGLEPAEFFGKMESGTLEKWDHRAHLRAGFYVLLEHLWVGQGLWDAAEDFLAKLELMLSNDSKQAEVEKREKRFRNTVHRTMTTFYLHSIHTAILAFMGYQDSTHILPKHTQFNEFLLSNPHLMDSSLWSTYYSKETMFSPAAKSGWRLPDLKPLPANVRRVNAPTPQSSNTMGGQLGESDRLQRFAFTILQRVKATGERRGKVIKESLGALQKHIMSQRAKGEDLEPYSETKAYFWIQILHAGVDSLGGGGGGGGVGQRGIDITALSFESFVLLFPDLMRHRDKGKEVWRTYYTGKSWESMEARMGLVFPTLKPLPNIITPPTKREKEAAVAREMEIRSVQSGVSRKLTETEVMLHKFWAVSEVQEASGLAEIPAATHGSFLLVIFSSLWKAKVTRSMSMGVASNELVGEDLRGRGDRLLGVTEKVFWVRVILQRFLGFRVTPVTDVVLGGHESTYEEIKLKDFQTFLGENQELSLENFWKENYSEETWHSEDAKGGFVLPDLKEMEKFV